MVHGLQFTVWFTVYCLVYRVVYGLQSGLQFTAWFTELFTVWGLRFTVYGLQSGVCVVHGFRLKFAVHSYFAVHLKFAIRFRSEQHNIMSFEPILKADFVEPTLARSRRRNLELQSI